MSCGDQRLCQWHLLGGRLACQSVVDLLRRLDSLSARILKEYALDHALAEHLDSGRAAVAVTTATFRQIAGLQHLGRSGRNLMIHPVDRRDVEARGEEVVCLVDHLAKGEVPWSGGSERGRNLLP